jgi:hypothetical protein
MEFSFKSVKFDGFREMVSQPIAASVRESNTNFVTIRISQDLVKKCCFKVGDMITPFLDEANRTVLLLSDQRPLPKTARKVTNRQNVNYYQIDFPRRGELADIFQVSPMRAMILREAAHGRLVFTVPKI